MTKEELREHCEKQVKACEMWAKNRGQEPTGKVYEEHKLILDLIKALEQQSSEETIKYLECNDIDVQEFTEAMKKQPLKVVQPNSMQLMTNKPTSDDCVSRQAVLNTLFYKSDNNCEVVLNKELQDRIKALPPVTPTHCIATVRFSKDDLREICNERIEIECTHGTCKDCENWDKECHYCFMLDCDTGKDFYCKGFEKRGDSDGSN